MIEGLRAAFEEHYGAPRPTHLVQAPGRVNLIGEHIDYNGLPVLPMAIQRRVAVLFRPRADRTVHITNANPSFPPRTFTLDETIDPYSPGDWGNYVKAAGQALARQFGPLRGFDAVVHSDLPVAAGLSSSSALVVASALPLIQVNEISLEPLELMQLLADGERYVGTRGGGMDQAVCLGAAQGAALRVDFNPLRLTPRPIPQDWRFVVAFSLVRAEKSGAAQTIYNRRTDECRSALADTVERLRREDEIGSYRALLDAVPMDELVQVANNSLGAPLAARFRHVVTEAQRVDQAEDALVRGDIDEFGRLMVDSHRSLRDGYEISCAELDELVEIAMDAGASGARLTGAGLGGCVVALCTHTLVDEVLSALRHRFYGSRSFDEPLDDHLFVAEPSGGASVTVEVS